MLRVLLGLLLAANGFWWAASHGWLPASWLPLPDDEAQREPQRLAQQVRPEWVTVLPATPARRKTASACLQSAPIADPAAADATESALRVAGVAPARWQRLETAAGTVLRLEAVDDATAGAVGRLPAGGPVFSPCP
jgi:hypothetical protein